jgi:hypothetical protein
MSEQNQNQEEDQNQEEQTTTQDVVEVEWEEVQEVLSIREAMLEGEEQLASWLLSIEKQKSRLLSRADQLEKALYAAAAQLRTTKEISTEFTYELKLPQSQGEKAYFVRKDL